MERMVGKPAPNFSMPTALGDGTGFGRTSLSDYRGKWLVVFFYPLDFTFVCPTEITGYSRRYEEFEAVGADVLAVSTDSEHSHKAWINQPKADGGLGTVSFPIGADFTKQMAADYGVLMEEGGMALRGLFIIDPDGVMRYSVVHDLNVGRSVDETLRVLYALQNGGLCPLDWKQGENTL